MTRREPFFLMGRATLRRLSPSTGRSMPFVEKVAACSCSFGVSTWLGILSLTSVPQISGMCDLSYNEKSGEFSGVVPLMVHVPFDGKIFESLEGEGCPDIPTRRFVAITRFEGRFRNQPGHGTYLPSILGLVTERILGFDNARYLTPRPLPCEGSLSFRR